MENKKSGIINVTRSSMPDFEEYCDEIRDIWDTHWLTNMGEKHQRLQRQLEEYLGVRHVTLLTNGHLALENVLEGLGLHGEIITTPYTFASTTHAIVRTGNTPVFCDINDVDYTIDVSKIENVIWPSQLQNLTQLKPFLVFSKNLFLLYVQTLIIFIKVWAKNCLN